MIAVSAVDQDGIRPDFSQCHGQVEIAAPGVDIMSTYPPNTYATLSGTSMAGPHVAGIAAQLMAFFPECTNYQVRTFAILLKNIPHTTRRSFLNDSCPHVLPSAWVSLFGWDIRRRDNGDDC